MILLHICWVDLGQPSSASIPSNSRFYSASICDVRLHEGAASSYRWRRRKACLHMFHLHYCRVSGIGRPWFCRRTRGTFTKIEPNHLKTPVCSAARSESGSSCLRVRTLSNLGETVSRCRHIIYMLDYSPNVSLPTALASFSVGWRISTRVYP